MTQNLKIRVYLMQNFMEHDMKQISEPKALTFSVWGLKTSLGQFGPKAFDKGLIKPLVENKIIKSQKISSPWGLGLKTTFSTLAPRRSIQP